MFENDKGKGIFMRKKNAQHFSVKQFHPNPWNVQNLHMPITIEACFQNTSIKTRPFSSGWLWHQFHLLFHLTRA